MRLPELAHTEHSRLQRALDPSRRALAQGDKQPLAMLNFGGIGEPVLAPELRAPDVLIPLPSAQVRQTCGSLVVRYAPHQRPLAAELCGCGG